MPTGKISKKQSEILEFMKKEILEKGYPPSVRQICAAVGLKSTSSVHAHLESLEKNGYIKKDATKPRAIEILDDDFKDARLRSLGLVPESEQTATVPSEYTNVPVIGKVAAGQPLLAVESIESYFPMPIDRLPNAETFMLKVQGESMVNAGILDGDYVLVEKRSTASDGEIIVALVSDSATVKTFYRENGYYRLQPENDFMEAIIVQGELQILGKVIGVFRFL